MLIVLIGMLIYVRTYVGRYLRMCFQYIVYSMKSLSFTSLFHYNGYYYRHYFKFDECRENCSLWILNLMKVHSIHTYVCWYSVYIISDKIISRAIRVYNLHLKQWHTLMHLFTCTYICEHVHKITCKCFHHYMWITCMYVALHMSPVCSKKIMFCNYGMLQKLQYFVLRHNTYRLSTKHA